MSAFFLEEEIPPVAFSEFPADRRLEIADDFWVLRATFRGGDEVSWPGIGRPLRAGPGRALISRASIFNSQLGQTSFGLIVWPQGRWTNSIGTPARPAIQRSPHWVIVAING